MKNKKTPDSLHIGTKRLEVQYTRYFFFFFFKKEIVRSSERNEEKPDEFQLNINLQRKS